MILYNIFTERLRMNKHYFSIIALLSFVSMVHAMETSVTITNNSSHSIEKLVIKAFLASHKEENKKEYKGSLLLNLKQGETQSVDLKDTKNKEKKENGSPSKWRIKNPDLPLTAAEYLDMDKLQECKVRTLQPQGFASRWKNKDKSDVRTFEITDNDKEEHKTTKKGEKVRRMLKVIAK